MFVVLLYYVTGLRAAFVLCLQKSVVVQVIADATKIQCLRAREVAPLTPKSFPQANHYPTPSIRPPLSQPLTFNLIPQGRKYHTLCLLNATGVMPGHLFCACVPEAFALSTSHIFFSEFQEEVRLLGDQVRFSLRPLPSLTTCRSQRS